MRSTIFPLTNALRDAEKEIDPIARRAIHSIQSRRTNGEWNILFCSATLTNEIHHYKMIQSKSRRVLCNTIKKEKKKNILAINKKKEKKK